MLAHRSWLVLPAVGVLNSGCILVGAAPPGRLDIGPALIVADNKPIPSARFTVGSHLASVLKEPLPFDVGLGYTLKTGKIEDPASESPDTESDVKYFHGFYLEGQYGFPLGSYDWSRAWVGVRGEFIEGVRGGGVVARGSWEASTYVEGDAAGAKGTSAGAAAVGGRIGLGVFLESGYQLLPVGDATFDAYMITAGISFRFPAFAAAGIAFPWDIPGGK